MNKNEYNDSIKSSVTQDEISWQLNVQMLNNRFFMADFFKVAFLSPLIMVLIVGVGLAVVGDMAFGEAVRFLAIMWLFGFIGLSVLMTFVCLAFFWNRFPMDFTVNRDFILQETGKRISKLNKFVVIAGAFFGSGRVVGAGLLAQSQESVGMQWESIRLIKYYPYQRVISVKNSWRTVLRLYCTAENYEQISGFCNNQFEATAHTREKDIKEQVAFKSELTSNIKKSLIWIGATLLSSLMLLACPLFLDYEQTWNGFTSQMLVMAAFGTCAAASLTGGEIRRFFGILSIVLAAGIAIGIIINGIHVNTDLFGLMRISGFENATSGSNLLPFVISMVGLVGLLFCSLRNVLSQAKLIPVAILALAAVSVGGSLIGGINNHNINMLRAQGPELQAVEINSWDSTLIHELKQKFNVRLQLYKLYMKARSSQKNSMKIQYKKATSDFESALDHVQKNGTKLDIQEAYFLNEAFEIWLKIKKPD